jgi:hypothetical protein
MRRAGKSRLRPYLTQFIRLLLSTEMAKALISPHLVKSPHVRHMHTLGLRSKGRFRNFFRMTSVGSSSTDSEPGDAHAGGHDTRKQSGSGSFDEGRLTSVCEL